jgi:hypothetical protein
VGVWRAETNRGSGIRVGNCWGREYLLHYRGTWSSPGQKINRVHLSYRFLSGVGVWRAETNRGLELRVGNGWGKEYLLFYRPGFLSDVWFGSLDTLPPPFPSASCLSFSTFQCVAHRAYWWERGEGRGEELNHKTMWKPGPLYSINYSMGVGIGDGDRR